MWVTVPKKRINSAPEWPASLIQEWSASGQKTRHLAGPSGRARVAVLWRMAICKSRSGHLSEGEENVFSIFRFIVWLGRFLIVAQIPWWWSPGFMIHTSAARARNQDFSDSICLDTYMKKMQALVVTPAWVSSGWSSDLKVCGCMSSGFSQLCFTRSRCNPHPWCSHEPWHHVILHFCMFSIW